MSEPRYLARKIVFDEFEHVGFYKSIGNLCVFTKSNLMFHVSLYMILLHNIPFFEAIIGTVSFFVLINFVQVMMLRLFN